MNRTLVLLLCVAADGKLKHPQKALFFHRPDRGFSAIRQARNKLMLFWNSDGSVKRRELYKVGRNPTEAGRNIAEKQPEQADKLQNTWLSCLESVNAPMPKPRKNKGRPQSGSKTD